MKQNKFLILLPILAAALLMAGCAKEDKAPESAAVQSIAEFEPMPIPEGGWTYEEVAKTVYINGKQISFPFTVESLGEGYSIKKKTTEVEGNGDVWTTLYYKKTPVCLLKYARLNDTHELESKKVTNLFLTELDNWDNKCEYEMVKVNGIGLNDDFSAVEELFGKPEAEMTRLWAYYNAGTKDACIGFSHEEEKIMFIDVRFDKIER